MATEPATDPSPDALWVPAAEAAARLGLSRARVYRLVQDGRLEAADLGGGLRISTASLAHYQAKDRPPGAQLAPLSAWAILALAGGDAAFRAHVAGRLSDPDRSRARARLAERGLSALVPRLHGRAIARPFTTAIPERVLDLLTDARLVLGGPSAARVHGWPLPPGDWPLEAYVAEDVLAEVVDDFELERVAEEDGDVVLRGVPGVWPFPPHARVVPELVAALDLTESPVAALAQVGCTRLADLAAAEPSGIAGRHTPAHSARSCPRVPAHAGGDSVQTCAPTRSGMTAPNRMRATWSPSCS